jgi:hypothetical protein
MILDDDLQNEANSSAEGLFPEWMTEDQRWEKFREVLAGEPARQRERAVAHLTLCSCIELLYPGLKQSSWARFGWNDVLSGKLAPEKFIHKLRLAKATGSDTGKL